MTPVQVLSITAGAGSSGGNRTTGGPVKIGTTRTKTVQERQSRAQLVARLSALGLDTRGLRRELIKRLEAHDSRKGQEHPLETKSVGDTGKENYPHDFLSMGEVASALPSIEFKMPPLEQKTANVTTKTSQLPMQQKMTQDKSRKTIRLKTKRGFSKKKASKLAKLASRRKKDTLSRSSYSNTKRPNCVTQRKKTKFIANATAKFVLASTFSSQQACRYGEACNRRRTCKFRHPNDCRFAWACTREGCIFFHKSKLKRRKRNPKRFTGSRSAENTISK